MTYHNSIEAYFNEGGIDVSYSIDSDVFGREVMMPAVTSFNRIIQHQSNRRLVPRLNMLVDNYSDGDGTFGTTVLVSCQASLDGTTFDLVVDCKFNRRLTERQARQVKAYITVHLIGDALENFSNMIGELMFECALSSADDLVFSRS